MGYRPVFTCTNPSIYLQSTLNVKIPHRSKRFGLNLFLFLGDAGATCQSDDPQQLHWAESLGDGVARFQLDLQGCLISQLGPSIKWFFEVY